MNEDNMRSITAYDNDELINKFKDLPNWTLKQGDIPGSYPYFLQKDDTKIYLDVVAENVIRTVNIYPQDSAQEHPSYHEDVLQELSKDLRQQEIRHTLAISNSDKEKL